MRVTLIHNPGAGDAGQPGAKALRKLIEAAGHELTYQSAAREGWMEALDVEADLIAVAGGDGTVGRVARGMAGRGVPLAVLPMGTANNIARSLRLLDTPMEALISGWNDAARLRVDAALAQGPWGERRFLEGLGIGLFAWTMPHAQDSKALDQVQRAEDAVAHVLRMLRERLDNYRARPLAVTLDGQALSGEYVLFEVMNLPYIGPNLHLAPDATPDDGRLHVVMVTEAERDRLRRYLEKWEDGRTPRVDLPTLAARNITIAEGDYQVHIDDVLWSEEPVGDRREINISVEPGVLEFLRTG
ncbi:MAG: diacylglycerol kinase family protein [Gammaproteobacteria bacterium]